MTEVARWYTRARRFPQLIGRLHDGRRIPFGPFTYLQIGAGAAVGVVMTQTSGLWGRDLMFNATITVIAIAVTLFVIGQIPPGRNPLLQVSGLGRLLFTRHGYEAVQLPKPGPVRGRSLGWSLPPAAAAAAADAPDPEPAAIGEPLAIPAPDVDPPPAPPDVSTATQLTGVQRLLATRPPT